ncbi:HD domain-containing protein [Terribacillus saccharophilus]|uniref:HD domain-containing protein n=1 Tax=Terribacillus saccharophilus TaxID=361277 RepID=UPI0020D01D44|nr:HD domain-containing protein [Terribacillus saccharophilus]
MMEQKRQLEEMERYAYTIFRKDATGHDFYHMKRVAKMGRKIAFEEGADPFLTEAIGWMHDIGDHKLFDEPADSVAEAHGFLRRIGLEDNVIQDIFQACRNISFSRGRTPDTVEGKIIQDADRLDAIGAIGIARTFAFGGAASRLIHWPNDPKHSSVQHFYDKLLKLKDTLHTKTALRMAESRHAYMQDFLNRFFEEWEMPCDDIR